jgi:hypothetical protein
MPADTDQCRYRPDTEEVRARLWMLPGNPDADDPLATTKTFTELGVDADGLWDMWAAVCEEFGEHSLGPEIDPGVLNPGMTVLMGAAFMVRVVAPGE